MTLTKALAVALVSLFVVGTAGAAYIIHSLSSSDGFEVEGGTVTAHAADELVIRCLSPAVSVRTGGFEGKLTFTNCLQGSILEGYNGEVTRNGTVFSLEVAEHDSAYELVPPNVHEFSFAVMGDSQGHDSILGEALDKTRDCDFVIHCGDLTPSGSGPEMAAVAAAINASAVPVFTTPGNHDVKNNGPGEYESTFGSLQYAFDYGGVRFAFLDSSTLHVSPSQISWLEETFAGSNRKVIVTHGTTYDPFEGNHTLDAESCDRLQDFALENRVTAVLSGHVHAYYNLRIEDTNFIITGGAGGTLTSGAYHWLRVNVTSNAFAYQKVDIGYTPTLPSLITLKGHGIAVNRTLEELDAMQQTEGDSSYQNQFWNTAGTGHYKGVTISSLLQLVGGITEGETLRITAVDGYFQEYGFANVNPNETWLELQGVMILALEFDSQPVPSWLDGPRIAMLPSDGLYSNSDCNQTSYPGQGYTIYPSAGARWVRNVATIEVVS